MYDWDETSCGIVSQIRNPKFPNKKWGKKRNFQSRKLKRNANNEKNIDKAKRIKKWTQIKKKIPLFTYFNGFRGLIPFFIYFFFFPSFIFRLFFQIRDTKINSIFHHFTLSKVPRKSLQRRERRRRRSIEAILNINPRANNVPTLACYVLYSTFARYGLSSGCVLHVFSSWSTSLRRIQSKGL